MLSFHSASARIINTKRGVSECVEIALGENAHEADLLIFHASIGHDFSDILAQAKTLAPKAQIVAASCCGVVGREGVSESMKDIALMAVKGNEFALAHTDDFYGHNSYEKCLEMAHAMQKQKQGINMIYFLGSGIDIANDECIRAFESVFGADVTIFGATSSDNMKGFISYQAVNDNANLPGKNTCIVWDWHNHLPVETVFRLALWPKNYQLKRPLNTVTNTFLE